MLQLQCFWYSDLAYLEEESSLLIQMSLQDPNFINEFSVAEIPTAFAIQDCEVLKKILPRIPHHFKSYAC